MSFISVQKEWPHAQPGPSNWSPSGVGKVTVYCTKLRNPSVKAEHSRSAGSAGRPDANVTIAHVATIFALQGPRFPELRHGYSSGVSHGTACGYFLWLWLMSTPSFLRSY